MVEEFVIGILVLIDAIYIYRLKKENYELKQRIKSFYADSYNLEIDNTIKDEF